LATEQEKLGKYSNVAICLAKRINDSKSYKRQERQKEERYER
jgi:hypothetical protein